MGALKADGVSEEGLRVQITGNQAEGREAGHDRDGNEQATQRAERQDERVGTDSDGGIGHLTEVLSLMGKTSPQVWLWLKPR